MGVNSVSPAPLSGGRAIAFAIGATYGPQLLMGLYTLCAVNCQHCRGAVWKLMALAPGIELLLFPLFVGRMRLNVGDAAMLAISISLSLLAVGVVVVLLRCWPRRHWVIFGVAFLLFSVGASVLLAAIRA